MNRKTRNDRFRKYTIIEWAPAMTLTVKYRLDEKQSHSPVDKARKRAREKKVARHLMSLYRRTGFSTYVSKIKKRINKLQRNRPLYPVIIATQTARHPHDNRVKYGKLAEVKNEQ